MQCDSRLRRYIGAFILPALLLSTMASAQSAEPCVAGTAAPVTPAAAFAATIQQIPEFPNLPDGTLPPFDPPKCRVATHEISCKPDGSGYVFTFTVTNNTGQPVTDILLTPPLNGTYTIHPRQPQLSGPLPNGKSVTLTVTITGGRAGQRICFPVTLITEGRSCCSVNVCVELPNCCARVKETIECGKDGSYNYTFYVTNTTLDTIEHIYLYPPAGVTMTPKYFQGPIAPGATSGPMTVKITGAKPGTKICFDVSLHTAEMKTCCTFTQCIALPACGPPPLDISLTKTFARGEVPNRGTFTLTAKNEAFTIAAGTTITITDPVPKGVTLTGLVATGTGWTCSPSFPVVGANTLTCTFVTAVAVGSGAVFPAIGFNATLDNIGPDVGIYQNCATVAMTTPAGVVTDTNPNDNRACAVTNSINPSDCLIRGCPEPKAVCKQDVLIVLDASNSIGGDLGYVKNAVGKYLQAMQGKGGRVNIFSFSHKTKWKQLTTGGWTLVTASNAGTLANGMTLTGFRTNWDDALENTFNVVQATSPKPLVLFVTDGDPNAFNDVSGNEVNTTSPLQAATEAVPWINAIRGAGSPIIAIGFGQVASAGFLDAAFTGNSNTPGNINFETSSVVKMDSASWLPGVMTTLGNQMCGTLLLNKRTVGQSSFSHVFQQGATVSVTDPVTFAIDLTNNSSTAISGIEVQDQVPPEILGVTITPPSLGFTSVNANLLKWWNITLAARQTTTLTFNGTLTKTYTTAGQRSYWNFAQVTAASGYTATQLGNMNAVTGPATETDESGAYVTETIYVPQPNVCEQPIKPVGCYVSVSKTVKFPNAEDGSCTSSPAGGATNPCVFVVSVTPSTTLVPPGSVMSITDDFTVNGTAVTGWAATVPTSFCTTAPTTVSFACSHGAASAFSGDLTVMIPPGQTGPKKNCVTVKITNSSPPLNVVTQPVCATLP